MAISHCKLLLLLHLYAKTAMFLHFSIMKSNHYELNLIIDYSGACEI